MGTQSSTRRRRIAGIVLAGGAAALAAGCNYGPVQPAPVVYETNPAAPNWTAPSSYVSPMAMAPSAPPRPQPYERMAERPLPPPRPLASAAPPPAAVQRGDTPIPLGGVHPPPPAPGAPTPLAGTREPAVVPLDRAPPAEQPGAAAPPPSLTPPKAPPPPPGERSVAEEAREEGSGAAPAGAAAPATHGGRFPWPVRGPIVASYGSTANGGRNDGINIAAPRGTPIRAIAAGEVAYAGNELRGYGNLVLIKHDDGWISAYAHCDQLLVKKGDKVAAGQVIAKVGTTGGVSEPQLHFELRRGKRAVDPREFLAPASSAGAAATERG
jgi:biotin carboxyl carrier protein